MTHITRIDAPPLFAGWARLSPRHRWRKIVTAADERTATNMLLDAVREATRSFSPTASTPTIRPVQDESEESQ